jgi:hypothetical protein
MLIGVWSVPLTLWACDRMEGGTRPVAGACHPPAPGRQALLPVCSGRPSLPAARMGRLAHGRNGGAHMGIEAESFLESNGIGVAISACEARPLRMGQDMTTCNLLSFPPLGESCSVS